MRFYKSWLGMPGIFETEQPTFFAMKADMKKRSYAIISSGISVIKRHCLLLFVAPLYLNLGWIVVAALNYYQLVPIVVRIIGVTYVLIFISYIILLAKYVCKRQRLIAIYCLFVSIITFLTFKSIRIHYGIDDEGIDFYFKQKEYRRMIEETPSSTKPGEPKLVIIEIKPRYACSTRYLVYDESDKLMNEDNNYYGIDYIYATGPDGEKFHTSYRGVNVRKCDEHIYIADAYPVDAWGASPCTP